MSEVKRYKITWDEAGFRYAVSTPLFEGAEVVRAEDYDALQAKLSAVQSKAYRLREALGKIDELLCGMDTERDSTIDKAFVIASNAYRAYSEAGTGAVDAWMPISTAPKDGTIILVAHRHSGEESLYESLRSSIGGTTDDGVYRCLWGGFQDMGEEGCWPDWWCMDEPSENWEYPLNPIAWMPLPVPPAKRDECPNGCVDGVIVMTGNTTLDRPRSCPIHGPKSGEGACPECKGKGTILNEYNRCPVCHGTGTAGEVE